MANVINNKRPPLNQNHKNSEIGASTVNKGKLQLIFLLTITTLIFSNTNHRILNAGICERPARY